MGCLSVALLLSGFKTCSGIILEFLFDAANKRAQQVSEVLSIICFVSLIPTGSCALSAQSSSSLQDKEESFLQSLIIDVSPTEPCSRTDFLFCPCSCSTITYLRCEGTSHALILFLKVPRTFPCAYLIMRHIGPISIPPRLSFGSARSLRFSVCLSLFSSLV